jgi:hypothetical protein
MELQNLTPYPALLHRGIVDDERLFGSVFLRITYELGADPGPDAELQPAEEQVWPVSAEPWDSEHGPMEGDQVFYRDGVDILLFGSARAPGGRPVEWMDVSVGVGDTFRGGVRVFGERQWMRNGPGLVPSQPRPFRELPLALEHAFGGADEWDELPIPFPDNPRGTGFYLDEERAEGRPLPRIEDPANPLTAWNDRPEPVGVGAVPAGFGPRVRRGVRMHPRTGALVELRPSLYNQAFPGMVAPEANPGDRVVVDGMREDGPLDFRLPRAGVKVGLRFGAEEIERVPYVDQVGIEPDSGRIWVGWRFPFRYRLVPLQLRECFLLPVGDALPPPSDEAFPAAGAEAESVEES